MSVHEPSVDGPTLRGEYADALARLEADLVALGASLAVTRGIAMTYRRALVHGAGAPGHPAWYELADEVARFLAGRRHARAHGATAAARRRLHLLLADRAG